MKKVGYKTYTLKSLCVCSQLSPTLGDPVDCSPLGSFVQGTLQARILEWIAWPASNGSSWLRFFTHWATWETLRIFLKQCNKTEHVFWQSESESHSVVSDSLRRHGLYNPWNSPGQSTGMSSLSLLQGLFPTQGSNPGLPHADGFFTSWATREAQEYWSG